MRKRSRKLTSREMDVNVLASRIVQSIGDLKIGDKTPAAVALGRMGGRKGGKARAEKLSPEQRRDIAQNAAFARWKKESGKK